MVKEEKTIGDGKYIDGRDKYTTQKPNLSHLDHSYTTYPSQRKKAHHMVINIPLNVFEAGVTEVDGNKVKTDGALYIRPTDEKSK